MYKKLIAGALALTLAAGAVASPVTRNTVISVAAAESLIEPVMNGEKVLKYRKSAQGEVYVAEFSKPSAESVEIPSVIKDSNDISYNVKGIDANVFKGKESLRNLTIAEGVTEIGASAFEGDVNLSFTTLPTTLQKIGAKAFAGCFGGSYEGKNANGTAANRNLTIQGSVNKIGANAFYGCGFENLTITAPIDTMDADTFANCVHLKNVTIGNRVKKLGDNMFYGCKNLEVLSLQADVNTIPDNFCNGCSELKSVAIPSNVVRIGDNAFANCSHLTSVSLNKGLETIGKKAFDNCERLESIIIPDSVKTIGEHAFGYVSDKPKASDKFTVLGTAVINGQQSVAAKYAQGLFTFKEYVEPQPQQPQQTAQQSAPQTTAVAKTSISKLSVAAIKKLKNGTDYKVTKHSKGSVTVKGTGNYTGTKKIKIKKAVVSVKAAKKALKVSTKKVSNASGYQFKAGNKSVKSSKASATVKGLKSKKKYTVKVRAYVSLGGKKYYGAWSSAKTAKTK